MLDSVFRIEVTSKRLNQGEPWLGDATRSSSGSGFALRYKGRDWIVTNAHVVSNATRIKINCGLDGTKYTVNVAVMAHACDLALLDISDETEKKKFWEKAVPLNVIEGIWTRTHGEVVALGFPIGGTELSKTSGSITRTDVQTYTHSRISLLKSETQAIINPGNSGGPVVAECKDGKYKDVIGVAFQSDPKLGNIIPAVILRHLLDDVIRHNRYTGFPNISMTHQKIENSALRTRYGIEEAESKISGVLLSKIDRQSAAHGLLRPGDVLLSVDGCGINNNGKIKIPGMDAEPIDFEHAINNRFMYETIPFEVWREKRRVTVHVPLTISCPSTLYPVDPEKKAAYVYQDGVIIQHLTYDFVRSFISPNGMYNGPTGLYPILNNKFSQNQTKWIKKFILALVLDAPETESYKLYHENVISTINGKKVSSIWDVKNAFDQNMASAHEITLEPDDTIIVLPKLSAERSLALRTQYDVQYAESPRYASGVAWRKFMKKFQESKFLESKKDTVKVKVKLTKNGDVTVSIGVIDAFPLSVSSSSSSSSSSHSPTRDDATPIPKL